jgi:tetratricopeptide (TPR) repeat protein
MRSMKCGMTFRYTAALVSGVLALGTASPAMGQPKPPPATTTTAPGKPPAPPGKKLTEAQKKDGAKKAFKAAEDKFAAGDYAGAIVFYQAADDLVPGAMPKYKIAVATEKMNKPVEAVAAYQKFLDASPDAEKFKDKIAEAKAKQEALRKTPAKVKVTLNPQPEPPGIVVSYEVDGVAQQVVGNEISVPPGKHKITAKATGYEAATKEVEVTFAEAKDLEMSMSKKAAAPPAVAAVPPTTATPATPPPTKPPVTPPSEPRSNVPAYVTIGLAGAGIVVGTIFGVMALGAKSDYEEAPTQELFDKAERSALLADMSYGIALTFGVTGIVLLLSNDTPEPAAKGALTKPAVGKPTFAPWIGPQGGGGAATLRF